MASIIASYGNDLIISTSFQVVSSGIKNIFRTCRTLKPDLPGAVFKHKKLNPAEHFGTFKHQPANRGSRNSPKRPKTELTKLTKLFTMEA
jgi:hypothetical protein